jgi:hypothetical protein
MSNEYIEWGQMAKNKSRDYANRGKRGLKKGEIYPSLTIDNSILSESISMKPVLTFKSRINKRLIYLLKLQLSGWQLESSLSCFLSQFFK